jgi:hypothetical protein
MAWAMTSPVRLIRRNIKKTPTGAALTDIARQPRKALRINSNSRKGSIKKSNIA